MALEVGTLRADLEVRAQNFLKGLNRGLGGVRKFEKKARKSFTAVGKTFARMSKKFLGVGALIAAAAGTFSFVSIIKGSIEAASAVDQFQIRLQNLIGSQELANRTIANLGEFAQKVAPSLKDLIGAAATLGTVSLGSSTQIETLTKTAANIQAVTGLTLTQSAQNLQRALSAGIGAADLFRERGVRAVLEALGDVPNLIDAPINEVRKAFDKVFGPDGVFKDAAEAFAGTLPGAISIAGDALFKFQATLGEALSPTIIATITEVLVPAFDDLTTAVKNNETEIANFARVSVIQLLSGLATIGRAVVFSVKAFEIARTTLRAFKTEFLLASRDIQRLDLLSSPLQNLFNTQQAQNIRGNIAAINAELRQTTKDDDAAAASFAELSVQLDKLDAGFVAFQAGLENFGSDTIANAAEQLKKDKDALAALQAKLALTVPSLDARTQRIVDAGIKRQTKLIETRNIAEAKGVSTTQQKILQIEKQNKQFVTNAKVINQGFERLNEVLISQEAELVRLKANKKSTATEIFFLETKIVNTNKEVVRLTAEQAPLLNAVGAAMADNNKQIEILKATLAGLPAAIALAKGQVQAIFAELIQIDPVAANKIKDTLIKAIADAAGNKDKLKAAYEKAGKEFADAYANALEEVAVDFGDTVAGTFGSSIKDTLLDFQRNGTFDFAESLADLSGDLLNRSLTKVLEDLEKSKFFEDFAGGIFGEDAGGALGSALAIGGSLLAGALKSTESNVSDNAIDSIVDSSQAVRGIVAGPQNIPIFQVANAISDAFVETNSILLNQLDELRGIRAGAGLSSSAATPEQTVNQQVDRGPSLG